MDAPEVRYAKSADVHIAYQVYGSGPINLVYAPGSVTHLDYRWGYPSSKRFFEALGKFARVAIFDKRGTGRSDRDTGIPTFEQNMDDIRAVMDAADFRDAVLFGMSGGVAMSILFAASYPARTRSLILYGGEAKGSWDPDYPWASTEEQWKSAFDRIERTWGTKEWEDRRVSALAPSRRGDEEFTRWLGDTSRMGGSPGAALALGKSEMAMDVRSILPAVHIPTLVIHLSEDRVCDVGEGRYIAAHVPNARLLELPGVDHLFYVDERLTDRILQEIKNFVTRTEPMWHPDRMLTTVLFTDIVGSTKRAAELGDSKWQVILERHNSMVKNEVERFTGSVVKNTGDGFLVTFDGPTRALRFAWAVTRSAKDLGIEIRAAAHTGECIFGATDVSGIAVHVASRILNEASAGQVLVSSTVRDLVYGSGISFKDQGEHELKGIEEKRRLFSVDAVN
ncbi:MAG: adenylate/guanylate cyclase domain-containing protein [Thermoplasmata archaeon]|nr:adenylate/guanylate cyclase domain-containing protein [Thermoplasmata archaeon]